MESIPVAGQFVTIANAGQTSGAISLQGEQVVGLFLPSAFTGTTMTFTACQTEGGTYVPVIDTTGTTVTITVGTSRYIPLTPATFAGIKNLKLVSGTAESAARSIFVVTRPV